MVARDLFGPAAEQRVHDRMAEIERERRNDLATAPLASVTWQSTPPRTLRERAIVPHVGAGRAGRQTAPGLMLSRKTASHRLSNILRKLGVRKRTAAVTQALKESLPGTPASREG